MTMSRTAEWLWILVSLLLLNLTYASTQPVTTFNEGLGSEGPHYHAMAKNLPRVLPPRGVSPFVYRLGTPVLAAGLAKSRDWVISAGFDRLNVAFNTLSVILLALLLQRHVASVFARLLVIGAFMVEPHSPVRYSYFYPVDVDPAALAGLLVGLLGIEWFHSRPGRPRAALLALVVAIGVTFREVMLVVGVCALFCRASGTASGLGSRPSSWSEALAGRGRSWHWLPLVSGILTLLAIHWWVVATPSDHSVPAEALRWLREKSLLRYGVAWFLVFGPLLAVPAYFWRRTLSYLRERPAFPAYLSLLAVLAWIGGGETERLLVFASPVVYVLIARAVTFAGVGPTTVAMASLLSAQAISSRVFSPIGGPIQPPQVRAEVWERLGASKTAWALSYENMWSQFCAPSMMTLYLLWYGLVGGSVLCFLWYHMGGHAKVKALGNPARHFVHHSRNSLLMRLNATTERSPVVWLACRWNTARQFVHDWKNSLLIVLSAAAVLTPVVWLAFSRFYWTHYAQPGYGYFLYNLARLWTMLVLLSAFWATGARIIGDASTPRDTSEHWSSRHIECAFCGAAAWSVGVVLLAMLHLYYVWMILPLVAVAAVLAISDLAATRGAPVISQGLPVARERWWRPVSLLRVLWTFVATAVLLTIALWGSSGGDNDVPGNYLPYYEAVLKSHWNGPNDYYVHFFVSKGNGLAFLSNILSDVQGAPLASYLILMLGGAMIWRLAARSNHAGQAIGLVGFCLYLLFYAERGGYGKSHIIRNTFILYLILSFAHLIGSRGRAVSFNALSRILVMTAVILLSPTAVALLLPILLIETVLIVVSQNAVEARRSLIYPCWALAATALVWSYNFVEVGLPEAPLIMQGRFMNVDRFSQWVDPVLAYMQYGGPSNISNNDVTISARQVVLGALQTMPLNDFAVRFRRILLESFNLSTMYLIGGSILTGALGVTLSLWRAAPGSLRRHEATKPSGSSGGGTVAAAMYLVAVLALLIGLRTLTGGSSGSAARSTDFIDPLGIALGVVLLAATWALAMSRLSRGILAIAIAGVACASMFVGYPSVLSLPWRSSVPFLIGRNTYAAMEDYPWDTITAHRLAGFVPGHKRVELLNFMPGFTAIPATPFQRSDGCAYIRETGKVLYGSEEQAIKVYAAAQVDYFLFDVSSNSPVSFSGFSRLFTPESIRSRMRLVTHVLSESKDLYLLTWNRGNAAAGGEPFEVFLQKWSDVLVSERKAGYYYRTYERGAQLMDQVSKRVTP